MSRDGRARVHLQRGRREIERRRRRQRRDCGKLQGRRGTRGRLGRTVGRPRLGHVGGCRRRVRRSIWRRTRSSSRSRPVRDRGSVAFLPDGSRAYVPSETGASLTVIDAKRLVPLKTIDLGKGMRAMGTVMAPDGKHLYVTTGRSKMVLFVDTATNKVVGSVEAGPRPWGIAISPDGKTLYTANGPSNDVSVIDVGDPEGDQEDSGRPRSMGDCPGGTQGAGAMTSESTERIDRSRELRIDARAGASHVWLVNPIVRTVKCFGSTPAGGSSPPRTPGARWCRRSLSTRCPWNSTASANAAVDDMNSTRCSPYPPQAPHETDQTHRHPDRRRRLPRTERRDSRRRQGRARPLRHRSRRHPRRLSRADREPDDSAGQNLPGRHPDRRRDDSRHQSSQAASHGDATAACATCGASSSRTVRRTAWMRSSASAGMARRRTRSASSRRASRSLRCPRPSTMTWR